MQDLSPGVDRRDLDALRKDVVQLQERTLELVDPPLDLRERCERQSVPLEYRFPEIVAAALARIRDHRLVLDGQKTVPGESIPEHLGDDTVQLPRLRGAGGEVLRPRQI